ADYLPKNFEDISRNPDKVRQLLCDRVQTLARSNRRSLGFSAAPVPAPASAAAPTPAASPLARAPVRPEHPVAQPSAEPVRRSAAPRKRNYMLVAIGTSTGGPVALQRVL